jgi:L-lactate dehydrogenase complex protein LldG
MTGAREEILKRVRDALRDVPRDEGAADVAVSRAYRHRGERSEAERLDCFEARLCDYGAQVRRVRSNRLAEAAADACEAFGLGSLVVPPELPTQWRPQNVKVTEDRGLPTGELDTFDGTLTGCAAAIAETGTVIMDGRGACGRRAITLVPDHHICIVEPGQLVDLVPEAIARLQPAITDGGWPVTMISGPSASSDIELVRVEGVHGPRHLLVLIPDDSA